MTAEGLRADVIDIWAAGDTAARLSGNGAAGRRPLSTILLVSHDIKEVAYMADRIIILAASPGRVRTVVENRLPRPRDYRSPAFLNLVDQLHEVITRTELPDLPAPAAGGQPPWTIEPLPDATTSEIVGLLEYLDARGGKEDVFRIAADTNRPFDKAINVVKAAELLDFVDTPKRMVVFEPEGRRFVKAGPEERKSIWREHLLKLRLFRDLYDLLQRQPRHEVERDFVLETLVMTMPQENYERTFQTFIRWARYGDLFAYDDQTEMISLQEEARPS
jgi:NitT/TauT family transport system ATP-binding protein